MAISIILEPTRSLNQGIKLLLDRTDSEFLIAGAMAGAQHIADRARQLVRIRTGDLQSTIRTIPRPSPGTGKSEAMITAGGMARSGNDVNYAGYVEFGTSRMAAFPFLRPAIDMYKESALVATGDAVIRTVFDPLKNRLVTDVSIPRNLRGWR